MSLDDSDAWSHRAIGLSHLFARQFDLAGLHLGRRAEPDGCSNHGAAGGLMDQARAYREAVSRIQPDFKLGQVATIEIYKDPGDLDHLLDGLRMAGLPE